MEQLYRQFIREKQYLQKVSPSTVEAYEWAWQAFEPALVERTSVAKADILQCIEELPVALGQAIRVNNHRARER